MSGYRRLLRVLSRSARDRARELDDEIEAHVELRVRDLVAGGMTPDEARQEALRRFGDLERAREEIQAEARRRDRALGWTDMVGELRRDAVVTLRRARKAPAHTALSVAVFALGIGLTTVMFTVVDHVVLRELPFPEPERLVALQSVTEQGVAFGRVSMGNWVDWRRENGTLASTALHQDRVLTVVVGPDALRASGQNVAGAFFETMRPPMAVGRAFTEQEAEEGAPVVVVSESFWGSVLGREPDLDGRSLLLDGRDVQVVGVVRGGREYPAATEIWVPRPSVARTGGARNNINWEALGRLAPEVTVAQAEADLSAIADGIRSSDPAGIYSWGVGVRPLRRFVVGDTGGRLGMLMGAVLFVLLIACANLAALGLARASGRLDEVALRLSLGAGRGRLFRQLATEQVLLGLIGGAAGLALAWWGTGFAAQRMVEVVPRGHEIGFDLRVAAAGFSVSLLAGVLAGLAPAWRSSGHAPASALAGARTVHGGRGLPGAVLVGTEVALTVLLLTGGALLLRSFGALTGRDLGFDPSGVVTAHVTLASPEYRDAPERVVGYWDALLAELEMRPGTSSVGVGNWIPTGGGGAGFIAFPDGRHEGVGAGYRVVSEEYFRTMRIPLVSGRVFESGDGPGTERVVVINQAMADLYWGDANPLGELVSATSMEAFFNAGTAPWLRVIGVVGDIRHYGFDAEPRAEMFVTYRQAPWMAVSMTAVARARPGEAGAIRAALPEIVRSLDPSLAVEVGSLDARVRALLAERVFVTGLLVGFAAVALLLASLGVYGVVAYAVATRTREVAIRAALGAGRSGLVRLMLRSALQVVVPGAAAGVLAALAFSRVLEAFLVDVAPTDVLAYVASVGTLVGIALAAAFVPARRAARLDPLEALREG